MAQAKKATKTAKLTAAQGAVLLALVKAGDDGMPLEKFKRTPTRTLAVLKELGCAKRKVAKNGAVKTPTWFATAKGEKILSART